MHNGSRDSVQFALILVLLFEPALLIFCMRRKQMFDVAVVSMGCMGYCSNVNAAPTICRTDLINAGTQFRNAHVKICQSFHDGVGRALGSDHFGQVGQFIPCNGFCVRVCPFFQPQMHVKCGPAMISALIVATAFQRIGN